MYAYVYRYGGTYNITCVFMCMHIPSFSWVNVAKNAWFAPAKRPRCYPVGVLGLTSQISKVFISQNQPEFEDFCQPEHWGFVFPAGVLGFYQPECWDFTSQSAEVFYQPECWSFTSRSAGILPARVLRYFTSQSAGVLPARVLGSYQPGCWGYYPARALGALPAGVPGLSTSQNAGMLPAGLLRFYQP